MSAIDNIKEIKLDSSQYLREDTKGKFQIYLHHTASSPRAESVIEDWQQTPVRVGTAFVVAGKPTTEASKWTDGDIYQAFGSQFWCYHLGLTAAHLRVGGIQAKTNEWLNKYSIGIEICNWGPLTQTPNGFMCWAKKIIPDDEVVELTTPYRGFTFYQKYTEAQLSSVRELIVLMGKKYKIPVAYKGDRIFNICADAITGTPGVYSHVSVRPDKTDCFPQPELIQMLQSL